MSVQATNGNTRAAAGWSAPTRALRLEKPRQTASSGDGDPCTEDRRGPKPTRRNAYRFDTTGVSVWNGPLLSAPYAAQVIGQALPERGNTPSGTAYRERECAVSFLLNAII